MDDLIEALIILRKYGNPAYPTHCEGEVLFVDVLPREVIEEDMNRLNNLGFSPNSEGTGFESFKFGSC